MTRLSFLLFILLACNERSLKSEDKQPATTIFIPDYHVTGLEKLDVGQTTGMPDLGQVTASHYSAVVSFQTKGRAKGALAHSGVPGKGTTWFCAKIYTIDKNQYVLLIVYETPNQGGAISLDKWTRSDDGDWTADPFLQ